jgi:hypothetical protein
MEKGEHVVTQIKGTRAGNEKQTRGRRGMEKIHTVSKQDYQDPRLPGSFRSGELHTARSKERGKYVCNPYIQSNYARPKSAYYPLLRLHSEQAHASHAANQLPATQAKIYSHCAYSIEVTWVEVMEQGGKRLWDIRTNGVIADVVDGEDFKPRQSGVGQRTGSPDLNPPSKEGFCLSLCHGLVRGSMLRDGVGMGCIS